jgi:tight adherence protein B
MDISLVSLIVFAAIATAVLAGVMLLRDLAAAPQTAAGAGMSVKNLRRIPTVFDERPARNLTGRLDQSFDRLVLESGFDMSPIAGLLLILFCGLLVGGSVWSYYADVLGGLAGTLIGMTAALVFLALQRARRQAAILNQLPYVLDLLARAVRAGESVDQAVELLGAEAGGVLGSEFARCSRQLQMGRSIDNVMKSLAARVRLVEMRILSTTLIVHRQTGGNLADTLERMSGVVRDRLIARRQMRASTGAARSSTMLIAIISPLAYAFMFLMQPEHVSVLYTDPLGMLLLATAFVMELVGVVWVLALMRQES